MKKSLVLIITVLLSSLVWSQGKTTLTLSSVNPTDLKVGDPVKIQLFIESPEKNLSSFQIYLKYDQDVLAYQGIVNVNPIIEDSWFDNQTPYFIAALYLDSQQKGIHFEGKKLLCEIEFIYNGGETNIQWGTESKIEDKVMYMGITKFTNSEKSDVILQLNNGCVCPSE